MTPRFTRAASKTFIRSQVNFSFIQNHRTLPPIVGYGVVAFLPNVGQKGDALIIEGTDSQATEAAGEFVTNEASMAELKRQLNSKTFLYFQECTRPWEILATV
jgi:hypothetical protein